MEAHIDVDTRRPTEGYVFVAEQETRNDLVYGLRILTQS